MFCNFRIVERGYYSEQDAAHVIKQILEAVAVRSRFSVYFNFLIFIFLLVNVIFYIVSLWSYYEKHKY